MYIDIIIELQRDTYDITYVTVHVGFEVDRNCTLFKYKKIFFNSIWSIFQMYIQM